MLWTRVPRSVAAVTLFRKAGLLCAALAMFAIAGGHWAVLQSVAWAQMLTDYARASGSVVTAVEQTFDGEHPCDLCRRIASGRAVEIVGTVDPAKAAAPGGQPPISKTEKKDAPLDTWAVPAALDGLNAVAFRWPSSAFLPASARPEAPPVPPPRARA